MLTQQRTVSTADLNPALIFFVVFLFTRGKDYGRERAIRQSEPLRSSETRHSGLWNRCTAEEENQDNN